MTQLSETANVFPVKIEIAEGVVSNELRLKISKLTFVALDQTTANELIPILDHFIKTGELPQ